MAEIDASIYSRLAQPQNAFGNLQPGQLLDLANRSIEFNTAQGVSNALKESYDPNAPASVNIGNALKRVARDPNIRLSPAHIEAIQSAERSGLARQTAETDLGLKRTAALQDFFGTLADYPNLSHDTLHNFAIAHARNNPGIPNDYYTTLLRNAPRDPAMLRQYLLAQQNAAIGSAGAAAPETGTPTASGAPRTVSHAAASYERAGVAGSRAPASTGMVTGVPPGTQEAAASTVESLNRFHGMADDAPNQRAILSNLYSLSPTAGTGPTAEFEKKLNQLAERFGLGGITMTPEQLKSTEEFEKFAHQIAGGQAAATHATDSYLKNAYGSNPNISLSRLGREGIIHMLVGNTNASEALRSAWMDYKSGSVDGRPHADNEFRDWLHKFNKTWDPRVFQMMAMTKSERDSYKAILGDAEVKKIEQRAREYEKRGWISFGG